MQNYKIEVTNSRPLTFKGELIASDKTELSTGRFKKLALYKTSGGNFVCQKIFITQWQGSKDEFFAILAKTEDEVIKFFGLDDEAKEIYAQANIDISLTIE